MFEHKNSRDAVHIYKYINYPSVFSRHANPLVAALEITWSLTCCGLRAEMSNSDDLPYLSFRLDLEKIELETGA